MIRLLAAELRRIAARRLVRLTAALALVATLLGGLAAFAFSGSLSEEAYQQRVAEADARVEAQDAQIESCLRDHGVERGEEISDDVARQCFPTEDVGRVDDPRFERSRLESILRGVTGALAVIGWGLGASLVGAEFASRSMTTLLTWEPRRGRVFVTKTLATMLATSALALAALVLVALAMWPALAAHGAPLRDGDPTLWSLAGTIGRGVALATISAGIGFAIATIGRNTAAALGAGVACVIVLENIVGTSLGVGAGGCCSATSSSSSPGTATAVKSPAAASPERDCSSPRSRWRRWLSPAPRSTGGTWRSRRTSAAGARPATCRSCRARR